MRYNYVIVRSDLSISQQAVQACHASYESGALLEQEESIGNYLILVTAPSEAALLKTYQKLEDRDIKSVLFREPDLNNEATALCTEPVGQRARKFFSQFKLWKGE